jgi:hypothetical protein
MPANDATAPKEDLPVYGTAPACSPFAAPLEEAWGKFLQGVAQRLKKRDFDVSIAASLKDAADLVITRLLPESAPKVVSFGGSMTVREAGLLESIKALPGLEVMDTFDSSIGQEAMLELRRQALLCDFYLCSVNAMTRDGVLLLLDGIGNRTAAVQFGPRKVVLLVGRNKICADQDEAVNRVRTVAAPANCVRLHKKTPCVKAGRCMDCNTPDRICAYWTIVERCKPQGRIHVVLINQDTGF